LKRTDSFLKGLLKRETFVFISRNLEHIEIVETTTLFGKWTVREETREVYLPNLKTMDKEKLRVIADAYTELHEAARRLKNDQIRRTIS
jgi:hypothetical protein